MSLILHPDFEKLKKQLSDLVYEYEELVNQICPNIERNYVIQFGLLEYTLYKKDFELDKLKMKLRLIQKEINNQNEVNIEEIDKILKIKFLEFEKRLGQSMDELNEKMAEKEIMGYLSDEDSKELKALYKKLIKKLHPDLNPNQTDFEKNLFIKSTVAFKTGNLVELESIALMLPTQDSDFETDSDKIKSLIKIYEDKITKIKEDYPYNKKDLVSDKKKSIEYVNLLNDLIESKTDEIKIFKEKINVLI